MIFQFLVGFLDLFSLCFGLEIFVFFARIDMGSLINHEKLVLGLQLVLALCSNYNMDICILLFYPGGVLVFAIDCIDA